MEAIEDSNAYHAQNLKQTNILLDLNIPGEETEQGELCVKRLLWELPTATGVAYPDFDYVESREIISPLTNLDTINIQLADLGSACWKEEHIGEMIQPPLLRAPEVALELPWDEKTDIWIAGHLVWESVTARTIFRGKNPKDLLDEMTVFFGPFPKALRERVERADVYFTPDGKLPIHTALTFNHRHIDTKMMAEIYCTGYMNQGKTYPPQTLEEALQGSPERPKYESPMSQEERKDFLAFIRLMLTLDPQARPSAKELMGHPWLNKKYDYPEYESL
ncbi:MAG: hypothetical protein Q9174_003252 [Haloplaca sp. 1 TL-2023]